MTVKLFQYKTFRIIFLVIYRAFGGFLYMRRFDTEDILKKSWIDY